MVIGTIRITANIKIGSQTVEQLQVFGSIITFIREGRTSGEGLASPEGPAAFRQNNDDDFPLNMHISDLSTLKET